MMEFPVVRRKINTYGKGARKIRVHDLFDVGSQSLFESPTRENHAPASPQPKQSASISQDQDESAMHATAKYHTDGAKKHGNVNSSPSLTAADAAGAFDIQSSEDDMAKIKAKHALKKRKISSAKLAQPNDDASSTGDSKVTRRDPKAAQNLVGGDKSKMLKYKSAHAKAVSAISMLDKSPTALRRPVKAAIKRPAIRPATTGPTSGGVALSKPYRSKELRVSSGSSADLSDASNHSRVSQRSTPKRKRGISDADADVTSPTPCDLHLTSLRLTPGSGSQRSPASSDDEDITGAPSPILREGRARLIDRLDAPRTQSTDGSTRPAITSQVQAVSQPPDENAPFQVLLDSAKDRPVLERQSSNVSVPAPARVRATYAKQRSYLSDMVDSLDSLPASNSQTSSQQNYSQALSFTSIPSQMELDIEDSDEPNSFSQVKSIHELRRGGAVKQFDLDTQSILEDVESSSKSSRIAGLLQLAAKIKEAMFLRQFQDSGNVQRFTDAVHEGLDEVSAVLVAVILQSLLSAESSSPRTLLQMLDALYRLPAQLLSEPKTLSQIAKHRSQNLSKLLIRDIIDFEGNILDASERACLNVDTVVLGSIVSAQRELIGLKEPLPRLPRQTLNEILSIFKEAQEEATRDGIYAEIEKTRLLLSILEVACTNPEQESPSLRRSRLDEVGQAVAGIMSEASSSHPDVEHSCLRLIVSLSNNDAKVCRALSKGNLISTVFQVVDEHFLALAGLAGLEKQIDNARLDSVILAVGCLLNLAECADEARVKMLDPGADGKCLVRKVVDLFNSHVDQASEVGTTVCVTKQ